MIAKPIFQARLAALRRGQRWWPAEFLVRGVGLVLLTGCWRLALVAHRMATTPPLHPARAADLAVYAGVVVLLCAGLLLTFEGPGLLRDVPLPGYFTQPKGPKP